VKAFFVGMRYFLAGFGLITQPGIKRFVAVPLVINGLLFIVLFTLFKWVMGSFNEWLLHFLPAWLHWLSVVVWILFFLSFLLFFVSTFVVFANLLAAPFNSLLSEKIEQLLTTSTISKRGFFENISDIPRIVGRQLAILGYYLPRAFFLLILFFIPVIQVAAPFLWFLFNAWFMTMTYLDYPTDNHRISLREMRGWMKEQSFAALGFGVSVLLASMVPVLNVLVMPAAVAGATYYWVRQHPRKEK
jgi:CysZ protein